MAKEAEAKAAEAEEDEEILISEDDTDAAFVVDEADEIIEIAEEEISVTEE